jgi:protein-S-isoprenylcysteine O-methyltransferase Ste14
MTNKKRMLQFQAEKSASIAPKIAITSWYIICTAAAVWLTFSTAKDGNTSWNLSRQVVLIICVFFYIVRAAVTLFVFVKRKLPWWEAAWGGSLIGVVLFFFLREGLRISHPLGFLDAFGALLYLTGSYVGTASEYSRNLWKARPENQGRLYTEGLFRHARHINYFGDLILFLGLGILTWQPWTVIVPLAMGLNFALVIIPAHDTYLAMRYGGEFDDYAGRTKKLVPFIY